MVYIHGTDRGLSPALVNAHYDSVSTSHGRGLILLMNCGEEDGLNGARAFGTHSLSRLSHIFLNLEGGGTGGRAILFPANDTAVNVMRTNWAHSRSATDYDIFRDALHMRRLDVAFYTHRSRYHTPDDDMRYASKRSISHMLLTALYTVNTMTADTSLDYNENLPGKPAVYFDFFNRIWTFYERSH
ncbi:uncharacterized protein LAJ45_05933 [Morchella importuna]|uniref:uncharacterized protein n=1 Tax=Morchella importuna TaxID=1174673 RepID=UPI001E8DF543|nr:uncharacterized protein LAJ45_05933 [Morchella importuna]KAH8149781.1 hypothetical protein LAJ45_05933 [Morchella importuna]